MPGPAETREMVQRALAYPYDLPERSFVQLASRTLELPPEGLDLSDRRPLLAYGSNAAPAALARKLVAMPAVPLPVIRTALRDFDVAYSAHVSPYGSVPAAPRPSPGTTANVFVVFPTEEQLRLLSATEPNYELTRLDVVCDLEIGGSLDRVAAYLSRHGCLRVDGAEIALAAIESSGRKLAAMDQPQVLELVRSQLFPELSLERFVVHCVEAGGIAPLPELTSL